MSSAEDMCTGDAITASAVEPYESGTSGSLLEWLADGQSPSLLHTRRLPLDELTDWRFDRSTGNLTHHSRRFFSVDGVNITTNAGATPQWMQPILDQPEIGILGFLVAYRAGILHVLVQRKTEPGNANISQISPTVQATHSNYTRVHGGAVPPYVEYFLDPSPRTVLVDQLQMEQAARYCGKRNRNIVVQTNADEVRLWPEYRWVTLNELLSLAWHPNALNQDTRSVLSCLPFSRAGSTARPADDAPFPRRALASLTSDCDEARLAGIRGWLARMEQRWSMSVNRVGLRHVAGWRYDGGVIAHESGRFFEIIGVSVEASTREVPRWNQPLVRSVGRGVIGFLCQMQEGTLRFLVQARLEPGERRIAIGPTVQCIPEDHRAMPPFFDEMMNAPESEVRFRAIQSEEGGRFYHDERLLMVVELAPGTPVDAAPEYVWMTLREIKEMIARDGRVNVEARSLIACLPVGA